MTTAKHKAFLGYKELYSNPLQYDDTFVGGSDGEVEFYSDLVKRAKNVLYLGSGSGRLLKDFLKVNKNITGVEIQKEMVELSKKYLPSAKIIEADALKLELHETFDLVIAPYIFACHFKSGDVAKLFGAVSKHLEKGGLFVGDMFSPYLPHDRTINGEIDDIVIDGDVVEKVYCIYDHEDQMCYEYVEKTNMKTHDYSMVEMPWNYYYPEQVENMLTKSGLKVKHWYGTFQKDPMTKDTPELIWVAEKD